MGSMILFLTSLALAVHRLPTPQLRLLPSLVTAGVAPALPDRVAELQPDSVHPDPYVRSQGGGSFSRPPMSRHGAGHPTDSRSGPAVQSRSPPVFAT